MTGPSVPKNRFPLDQSRVGQHVRVADFAGGTALRAHLHAMGLVPGVGLEVVSANGGPMILKVMGSRLMLGRGIAAKILVREMPAPPRG